MLELNDIEVELLKMLIEDKLYQCDYDFEINLMYDVLNKCNDYLNTV